MSQVGLTLTKDQYAAMREHVLKVAPEEACGLLAGKSGIVKTVIPITNEFHSPVRYNMDPKELIKAFYEFEAQDMELVATFHSHPAGPSIPSETDLSEYAYSEAFMLIWAYEAANWDLKGFTIYGSHFEEINIFIEDSRNH